MSKAHYRLPKLTEQQILDRVEVRLVGQSDDDRARFAGLMCRHHYLKSDSLVGEQIRYVAVVGDQWVALLSWCAASRNLKDREEWIGWDTQQKHRRLALVANNARFLILPGIDCPNLASRVLALCGTRLSGDWQQAYGHPILVVESFVDSQLFRGTSYKAQGWQLLGQTKGFGRARQDFYTEHERPKQLWVRQLQTDACRVLSAARLPGDLQAVEDKVIPRCPSTMEQLRGLYGLCREVPEWRHNKGLDYRLPCLLAIMVLATVCGVVRGQRDLAAFASKLTQRQLKALHSYRGRDGKYQYPKESTFQRVLATVDAGSFERILQKWADALIGGETIGTDDLIAIDGKALRGSTPHVADEQKAQLVSALSLPSLRVLGTVPVERKSNEIPAARQLLEKLGPLEGKLVMLDALHTCQASLRQIHIDNGADFLMPVKGNQDELEKRALQGLSPPHRGDAPSGDAGDANCSRVGLPPLKGTHGNVACPPVRFRRKQ